MGLASVVMLASCAKDITADEATKIAGEWKADLTSYKKMSTTVKNSKGESESNETTDATAVALAAVASRTASQLVINGASSDSNAKFKADGTALEVSYKSKDGDSIYKTNADGLATYLKVTSSDGSWVETVTTWSK